MNLLLDWNLNQSISSGNPLLLTDKTVLSYAQSEIKIDSYAAQLSTIGIRQNDLIAIISENNIDFIFIIFALWKLGAIPVPINTRLTNKEVEELVNFAGCKFAIIQTSLKKDLLFNKTKIINDFPTSDTLENYCAVTPDPENTAIIFFTSGSTGKPKGVELSFDNLISSAFNGNSFLNQTSEDKWLAALPFYHIGGFSIIIRALLFGASIILPESLSIKDLGGVMATHKPTLTSLVSTQLRRILESGFKPNKNLRNVLIGGGFIEEELIRTGLSLGWNISKVYGSTETSSFVAALNCANDFKISSVGKAVSSNKIFIEDEEGKQLTQNTIGEVVVQSKSVAKGYFKNSKETERKFRNGKYYTGDIGRIDEEGYLYIEARRIDLIITGGENVNPLEVENALLKHPQINEAAVFGLSDAEWGHSVAATIVTDNNFPLTIEQLKEFLKDKIAGYKIPRRLFLLEELPKTSLGKIQKEKIKQLLSGF